jgi:hypothetical protein
MSSPSEQTTVQRKSELRSDIQAIYNQIEDGLAMGDSMFGQYAHVDVAREVSSRTKELQKKKEELEEDIRQKEAIIQRTDRDFTDVKDTLPETLEEERIRFIEDYTLLFLSLAYVFMVVSAIVYFVALSPTPWRTLGRSLGYSLLGTFLAGVLLYVIA